MSKTAVSDAAPKPAPYPTSEEEFVFEDPQSVPAYAKPWVGVDRGPVLQVPRNDIYDTVQPYSTQVARIGDTVKFIPMAGSQAAHFEVVPGGDQGTADKAELEAQTPKVGAKVVVVTNASLEDQIKTGHLAVEDLTEEQKVQVLQRSPGMKRLIEPEAA